MAVGKLFRAPMVRGSLRLRHYIEMVQLSVQRSGIWGGRFMKFLQWVWAVVLILLFMGAVSDGYWIPATLFVAASVAALPIAAIKDHVAARGLSAKAQYRSSFALAFVAMVALAIQLPSSPQYLAEERSRAAAAAKAEQAAAGEARRVAKEKARKAALAKAAADEKAKSGFDCLSTWNGSSRSFVTAVKAQLRDPDSFKHYETRITPRNAKGNHLIFMDYGARNGFGGMNRQTATGVVDGRTCEATVVELGE